MMLKISPMGSGKGGLKIVCNQAHIQIIKFKKTYDIASLQIYWKDVCIYIIPKYPLKYFFAFAKEENILFNDTFNTFF